MIRGLCVFDRGDDEWFAAGSYEVADEHWGALVAVLGCQPPEAGRSYFIEGYALGL
ncbi:hypothetical protein [Actinomadura flavalba]|uniref:hypothetical protein n=1 Tax=Actinomadura flavalba TaxID=1120938 RepID=UPI0003A13D8C|nr:hypothetical protein [Actinomadura flavalba]